MAAKVASIIEAVDHAVRLSDEDRSEKNDERAVRAASFLLDWASSEGNEELEGVLALGLSRVLARAANNMAQTRRRNHKLR